VPGDSDAAVSRAATRNPDRRRELREMPLGEAAPLLTPGSKAYRMGRCQIIVSQKDDGWHLSISRTDRLPSWEELRDARYELVPDGVTMAMLLPPRSQYVNVHDYCLHLYEVPGE
jgi:hypothetical protein